MQWEVDRLREAGVTPEVDDASLQAGALVLSFDWPLKTGGTVRLQAAYPDSFPYIRPHVRLLSGPEPLPVRHRSPTDGTLCLLGRESSQWVPSLTLAKLLEEQLEHALNGTGEEDPQGEPADVWWNGIALPDACCLIDSSWDPGTHTNGRLQLRWVLSRFQEQADEGERFRIPVIRGLVSEVRASDREVIHAWQGPVPAEFAKGQLMTLPWVQLDQTLLPSPDWAARVTALRAVHRELRNIQPVELGQGAKAEFFAVAHPVEVSQGEMGLGWILFQATHVQRSAPKKKELVPTTARLSVLPVYRAGSSDLGQRVPAVQLLATKRVLIVGAGAVGAPLAIELARNGCACLRLVEFDVVEPGNSIRWPLGTSAWGHMKADALRNFIRYEYPRTEVQLRRHRFGQVQLPGSNELGDDEVLEALLPQVDLVIDASASNGVTFLLDHRCRQRGLPLISLFATPSLEGGAVVRHTAAGGCPNCLLYAWNEGRIVPPPGLQAEEGLAQPPGCAERTFLGAGYDLQEISLQAMRLAVETLAGQDAERGLVQTLSYVDDVSTLR